MNRSSIADTGESGTQQGSARMFQEAATLSRQAAKQWGQLARVHRAERRAIEIELMLDRGKAESTRLTDADWDSAPEPTRQAHEQAALARLEATRSALKFVARALAYEADLARANGDTTMARAKQSRAAQVRQMARERFPYVWESGPA